MNNRSSVRISVKLFLAVFLLGATCPPLDAADLPALSAKWIWVEGQDVHAYNQTVLARKRFRSGPAESATLRITADSFYRVLINDRWVADGPCRSWPSHYQYDVLDVAPYLNEGRNEILVIARYFGVGDFHRVPQQAGLLAQLDIRTAAGRSITVPTDASWEMADAPAWLRETPKVSIQMEPAEFYDARQAGNPDFSGAAVLFEPANGPWQNLQPRDVALMNRQPRPFRSFLGANLVKADGLNFCFPAVRLCYPGLIEANHHAAAAAGLATLVDNPADTVFEVRNEGLRIAIDGREVRENSVNLSAGRHLLVAFPRALFGHEKEKAIRFPKPENFKLVNPLEVGHENPFVLVRLPEATLATNDIVWPSFSGQLPAVSAANANFARLATELFEASRDPEVFKTAAAGRLELWASREMFVEDTFWQFTERQVVGDALPLVQNPSALLHDSAQSTIVAPSPQGDIELRFDLGEQDVGYYDFELMADAGVEVDIYGIEYIDPEGRLQHSFGNRNGMRYITRQGVNRYTSLKRRSGRYLFLTLRQQRTPVAIRHFQLISSTYPTDLVGAFSCSDPRLDQIWDISTRTLKLCMEDTFTDCPLYEQTHWVGDARNESLLAFSAFGACDLARRCANITAHSLERFPITGCQTPSCWDVLLPAWSFLWTLSTWDYYYETGDRAFVENIYPAVVRNLQGAEALLNDDGLFSGPFWNMFDWTGSDQDQRAVLHNSMFMVGAINAALKEAELLGKSDDLNWLKSLRERTSTGVNRFWDNSRRAYPDSLHSDGKPSPSTSQHTSILGLLYDVTPPENRDAAVQNLLHPPEKMVRLGSPFAALYLYEALEKLRLEDEIIKDIYKNYVPMLEAGATTVWESFPTGTTGGGRWPTRSHCHAWSSAPTRFLNRIILGVKTTAPGGTSVSISPVLSGLQWARGTTLTSAGPVNVSWKLEGKTLRVEFSARPGVTVAFLPNRSHDGLEVMVNGKPVSH